MKDLLQHIKSRGWWHVTIRPGRFDEHRIAKTTDLLPIIWRCVVSLRGWDFPHLNGYAPIATGRDWIGQEFDWQQYRELWRFYTSGQFVYIAGLYQDWRDRSEIWPPNEGWKPGADMPILDTAFRLAEIYEFAARLALTDASDATMHVGVRIEGLAGRRLYDERAVVPASYSTGTLIASEPSFVVEKDYDRAELIANSRAIATEVTRDLLCAFGWQGPVEMIHGWQQELFGRAGTAVR